MSVQHIAWAMEQTTGNPTRKAVLVALADFTNAETGKCCPYIATIANRTELSDKTVQRALNDLVDAGFVTRTRRKRNDGKQAGYDYRLPAVLVVQVQREPVDTESGGPQVTESAQEPGTSLEPQTPSVVSPSKDLMRVPTSPWKVDRQTVTESEAVSSAEALDEWNRQTGQSLKSKDWRAKIVMRQREHPDLTMIDHAAIIAAALADPWWKGPPSPSVVYGNGALFERCIEATRRRANGDTTGQAPPPRRYGRGMTTREMLDTIPRGGTT